MTEKPSAVCIKIPEKKDLRKMVAPFRGGDTKRSMTQLAVTLSSFVSLWIAMWVTIELLPQWTSLSKWACIGIAMVICIPAAAFVVRLFIIQHDCGHGSFLKKAKLQNNIGFFLGILTLTPYEYWRKTHHIHHAHSGDLDSRDFGELDTLTLAEYKALSFWKRLHYRIYRNPATLLILGPTFHFFIKHRFPWDIPFSWKREWKSVWLTNVGIVVLYAILIALCAWLGDWKTFIIIQLPVSFFASAIGIWLFYLQHQYEDTYWQRHENWDFFEAALLGSSHFVLPYWLQWLTGHIGVHHVHHMNSLIPNYKLQACLEANPELQCARKVTLFQSFSLFTLTLWDEATEELISFREASRRLSGA